jgi:hypothetical protein
MRIVKVLGVIASMIALTILIPVALGLISRSPIAALGLGVLVLIGGAILWGCRMDAIASQSWFIRMRDVGATTAHDHILQDIDDLRRRTHEPQQRRDHDAE